MGRYVLSGGHVGYERLQVLARERWPDTRALLQRAGLRTGMRCIDVGCGGGEVTFALGALVAPGGEAVGIDMDEIKIERALELATEHGLENVTFRTMNVMDWNEPDAYDLVYCRFLLHHLTRPADLLGRMWAAVRPGGVIVIEDVDFEGWCSYPQNDGFDFYVRTYIRTLNHWGNDHTLGRRLYSLFLEAGIPVANMTAVQPVRTDGEGKTMALLTLAASRYSILESGASSEDEFDAALESLSEFTADPRTLISGPRIFQAWATR